MTILGNHGLCELALALALVATVVDALPCLQARRLCVPGSSSDPEDVGVWNFVSGWERGLKRERVWGDRRQERGIVERVVWGEGDGGRGHGHGSADGGGGEDLRCPGCDVAAFWAGD